MTEQLQQNSIEALQAEVEALQVEVEALKHEVVGLEHRLVQVVRNAYWALTQRTGWTVAKRLEAGAALIRYFLTGRAAIVIGISLGGLLALHASFMLADQNRKLDLQNHLAVVSSEIAEAQRNSQFAQLIPPLLADVNAVRAKRQSSRSRSSADDDAEGVALDSLSLRTAVLTQTFQPYRWIDRRVDATTLLQPSGSGPFYEGMKVLRHLYDAGFGKTSFETGTALDSKLELPLLTSERYSPERGLLLVNLFASKIELKNLTRYNVTFVRSFAPGARLDGIDLSGLVGPALSKPLDFTGSYFAGATFTRAKMEGAVFARSNLEFADIRSADGSGAQWSEANLRSAQLDYTNLQRSVLTRANFTDASLLATNLSASDLTDAVGLQPKQLEKACIDVRSTRLPPRILAADYSVPLECCRLWGEAVDGFVVSAQGKCTAKPS